MVMWCGFVRLSLILLWLLSSENCLLIDTLFFDFFVVLFVLLCLWDLCVCRGFDFQKICLILCKNFLKLDSSRKFQAYIDPLCPSFSHPWPGVLVLLWFEISPSLLTDASVCWGNLVRRTLDRTVTDRWGWIICRGLRRQPCRRRLVALGCPSVFLLCGTPNRCCSRCHFCSASQILSSRAWSDGSSRRMPGRLATMWSYYRSSHLGSHRSFVGTTVPELLFLSFRPFSRWVAYPVSQWLCCSAGGSHVLEADFGFGGKQFNTAAVEIRTEGVIQSPQGAEIRFLLVIHGEAAGALYFDFFLLFFFLFWHTLLRHTVSVSIRLRIN